MAFILYVSKIYNQLPEDCNFYKILPSLHVCRDFSFSWWGVGKSTDGQINKLHIWIANIVNMH